MKTKTPAGDIYLNERNMSFTFKMSQSKRILYVEADELSEASRVLCPSGFHLSRFNYLIINDDEDADTNNDDNNDEKHNSHDNKKRR